MTPTPSVTIVSPIYYSYCFALSFFWFLGFLAFVPPLYPYKAMFGTTRKSESQHNDCNIHLGLHPFNVNSSPYEMYSPYAFPSSSISRTRKWDRRCKLHDLALTRPSAESEPSYPCTEEELKSYRRQPPPNPDPPMRSREAVRQLEAFLERDHQPTDEETAAHERLRAVFGKKNLHPVIAIKAFKDLDMTFFNSKLMWKTNVVWADLSYLRREFHGSADDSLGFTIYLKNGTSKIFLNASRIFFQERQNPYKVMWSTLLHEMVVS